MRYLILVAKLFSKRTVTQNEWCPLFFYRSGDLQIIRDGSIIAPIEFGRILLFCHPMRNLADGGVRIRCNAELAEVICLAQVENCPK
jgi:hypothetical protein